MIQAIETRYKGYRFRSRLEARWAVFFEALGLQWEYEKEGFVLPTTKRWYLPDFYIAGLGWFEIKPRPETSFWWSPPDGSVEEEFFIGSDWPDKPGPPGGILYGTPGEIGPRWASDSVPYAGWDHGDGPYYFCECMECHSIGFQYEGRAERNKHKVGCNKGFAHKMYTHDSPRILAAAEAARSARFEHGEVPA
jgi:hypothetical protein